jgi:hypothetical protein
MKNLTLLLTGLSLAFGASVARAQQPTAPTEASTVSSYSAPTEKHVKKPKSAKQPKKGASAPMAAPAEGASQ